MMSRCRPVACVMPMLWVCLGGVSSAYDSEPILVSGEKSLSQVVLRINEGLQAGYGLLDPTPLTVDRFRKAVEAKMDTLAKSDKNDRLRLIQALQQILAEGRLPDRFSFYLSHTSARYKEESLNENILNKRVANLSYNLSVPVPVGRETTQTVRLLSLDEQFFILKVKRDVAE